MADAPLGGFFFVLDVTRGSVGNFIYFPWLKTTLYAHLLFLTGVFEWGREREHPEKVFNVLVSLRKCVSSTELRFTKLKDYFAFFKNSRNEFFAEAFSFV